MTGSEFLRMAGLVAAESCRSFQRNQDTQKAATAAYYSFLAIIPLCLLVIGLTGRLAASSEAAMAGLGAVVRNLAPVAAPALLGEVAVLVRTRTWGLVSLLVLAWSVAPLAAALRNALGAIFMRPDPRPFWARKLCDLLSVSVLVTLLMVMSLEQAYGAAESAWLGHLPGVLRAVYRAGPPLLALAALGLILRLLVPVRLPAGYWLAGSAVTLLLMALVGPAFSLLLRVKPDYGHVFGSLKAVFLLVVWVYYSFAALLFGAEVMANIRRRDALVLKRLLAAPPGGFKPGALLNRHIRVYPAGAVICREGEPGHEMFFIVSGAVALSQGGRPLLTLPAGAYFGELSMLIATPRTATAVSAAPETALAAIARPHFETVLGENPGIVLAMLQEMASRLKATTAQAGPSSSRQSS